MGVGGQEGPHADPAHLAMPILNSTLAVLALPMVAVVVFLGPKLQDHFAVCRMGAEGHRGPNAEPARLAMPILPSSLAVLARMRLVKWCKIGCNT